LHEVILLGLLMFIHLNLLVHPRSSLQLSICRL